MSADDYLLKYDLDESSATIDVTLQVGSELSLTAADSGVLQVKDITTGRQIESLDLSSIAECGISVGAWSVTGEHAAAVELAPSVSGEHAGAHTTRVPKKAWYSCLLDHGVSGAIAGAVSGCAATATIGCLEGALTGVSIGFLGAVAAALWSCRGKY